MKRAAYLTAYALFAALGASVLARPALLAIANLGLFAPVLPLEVPLGWAAAALLALIAALTVRFALRVALDRKPRVGEHVAFLALVAGAIALRSFAGEPQPPADPTAPLIAAMRAAADLADAQYTRAGKYALSADAFDAELARMRAPPFTMHARRLGLRAAVIDSASGPVLEAPLPGMLIVAASKDGKRCWITAFTLAHGQVAPVMDGPRPLVLQARAGTHSAPGRDPVVPAYPGMRSLGDRGRR